MSVSSLPFRRLLRSALLASLLALAPACGAPVDNNPDGGNGDGGQTDGGPPPVDQCQGDTDLSWLGSKVNDEQTGRELAREAAGDCGLGCLSEPKPDKCAIKCMTDIRGVQLTDGCAGCYGGIVLCTINKCINVCMGDPQAQICKDCQEEKGCNETFYACTGPLPE